MSDLPVMRVSWSLIVQLATEIEARFVENHRVEPQLALRLVRAALAFQQQLLGNSRPQSGDIDGAPRPARPRRG